MARPVTALPTPPANPASEVGSAVDGLTKAQRDVLVLARYIRAKDIFYAVGGRPAAIGALRRKNLISCTNRLEPLGLAVREYLLSPARKEESDV